MIGFIHEVKHLTQPPATKGSVQWYYNEIEALKLEIEIGKSTNSYNSIEISIIKDKINEYFIEIELIKGS